MAATRLVEEEGSLLEHALRRIKTGKAESAWGMRWVDGEADCGDGGMRGKLAMAGGAWQMVELREAVALVNPVARKLVAALEERGVRLEWVQHTLVKKGYEEDVAQRDLAEAGKNVRWQGVAEGLSVDVVLSRAVEGQGGRRDYWWVEVKWTRGDHNSGRLRVVRDGWKKVNKFEEVVKELGKWGLMLGGHMVFRPQRLGLLVVSPRGWRLEFRGGGIAAMGGSFVDDGGGAVAGDGGGVEDGGQVEGGGGGNAEGGDERVGGERACMRSVVLWFRVRASGRKFVRGGLHSASKTGSSFAFQKWTPK